MQTRRPTRNPVKVFSETSSLRSLVKPNSHINQSPPSPIISTNLYPQSRCASWARCMLTTHPSGNILMLLRTILAVTLQSGYQATGNHSFLAQSCPINCHPYHYLPASTSSASSSSTSNSSTSSTTSSSTTPTSTTSSSSYQHAC